jgi:hypothetical protein
MQDARGEFDASFTAPAEQTAAIMPVWVGVNRRAGYYKTVMLYGRRGKSLVTGHLREHGADECGEGAGRKCARG